MTYAKLLLGCAIVLLSAGAVEAQQKQPPFHPIQTEIEAERTAGAVLMEAGEQYLNAGVSGPDSKSCRLVTSAMQHFNNAASLSGQERALVKRDRRMLETACRAS